MIPHSHPSFGFRYVPPIAFALPRPPLIRFDGSTQDALVIGGIIAAGVAVAGVIIAAAIKGK